jgi:polyhydroxyalkanoate synthesis regulator phasin
VADNAYPGGTGARSGSQSIRDLIERTFLMGVGAAAFTKDRVQELVDEFVRRGELSTDEGREMVDRLVSRSRDEARSAMKRYDSSLQSTLRDFGVTTRRDFEDLETRVRELEHRIALLERTPDAATPGPGGTDAGIPG